jgi:hypothetical protein
MKTAWLFDLGNPNSALMTLAPTTYHIIFTGAIFLVAIGIVLWAGMLRKRRKRRELHHWRRQSRQGATAAPEAKATEPPPAESKKRRRRRRRSEPPRNPTLAETRGLPPVRDAQPPEQN